MAKSADLSPVQTLSPRAKKAISRQSNHLNSALIVGAVSGLIFYIYTLLIMKVNPVPILGETSLARPAIGVAAIITFVLFWTTFNRTGDKMISPSRMGLTFNAAVLSFATTILGTSLLAVFAVAMDNAFKGLEFDIITASLIIAGITTATAYMVVSFASSITIHRIYTMLIVIMFGGILISAIAVATPNWYEVYLSALGMADAGNIAKLFNFSLIFAGIMLIAMANVLFRTVRDFYIGHPRVGKIRFGILYTLFVLSGIFLAGIGAFPFIEGTTQGSIHMASAGLLGVVFVLWTLFLRLLIPFFEDSFYNFSIAVGISIATVYILATLKIYFNVTGEELTVFVLATAWLSLFLTNMFNAVLDENHAKTPLPEPVSSKTSSVKAQKPEPLGR